MHMMHNSLSLVYVHEHYHILRELYGMVSQ